MKLYDVTMTIREGMDVYKGRVEKQPVLVQEKEIGEDGINESRIVMNLHTGTHLDAPLHMLEKGEDITRIPLEKLLVEALVLDCTHQEEKISTEDLQGLVATAPREGFVLLKTRNSLEKNQRSGADFIYLAQSGAEWLASLGIAGVGIDGLGIERNQPGHPTHKTLMQAGILILEGLELSQVPPGRYFLVALPLKIAGAEGAPARVLLIDGAGELFGKSCCEAP